MKLESIVTSLGLTSCTANVLGDTDVHGGYCSDLLSDVIAKANENDVWITMQVHKNIVAVAAMKNLAGIILVNGRVPDQETINKGVEENIPVFTSSLSAFEVAGRLYGMGLRGDNNGE